MLRNPKRLLHRGVQTIDMLCVVAGTWSSVHWQHGGPGHHEPATTLAQAIILSLAWMVVAARFHFYQPRRTESLGQELRELAEAWFVAFAVGSVLVFGLFDTLAFEPFVTFVCALGAISCFRVALRVFLRRLRYRGLNSRSVILVGRGEAAGEIAALTQSSPHFGLRIVGSMRLPGETGHAPIGVQDLSPDSSIGETSDATELETLIARHRIDAVVLCPGAQTGFDATQRVLEVCDVAGIRCTLMPELAHLENLKTDVTSFCGIPGFRFHAPLGSPTALLLKRAMDVLGAMLGLILLLPLLIVLALAIKFQDGGPLFFRQLRIGKNGQRFFCLKFRSMNTGADADKARLAARNQQDGPAFKIQDDPRVTPVGRILRKYSLDELPQLFNVLSGDMSLVGPRPPVPDEVAQYSPRQRRRISVRPGLTCLWQVEGRNRVSFDKWVEMDLFYIDNWSLWMDVKLIAKTMPAVVRGTGM